MAFEDPKAEGTSLSLDEATPLATAFASRVAERLNIRLLVLKGPLTVAEGLRPPRPSYDSDVLVDPKHSVLFINALGELGWEPRPSPGFPTLLTPHSQSVSHSHWSVDLDVHWNWPGFLLSDSAAFDLLWSRSRTMSLAGVNVEAPARADSALVLALHVLRESRTLSTVTRRQAEYDYLVKRVHSEAETRAEVRNAARLFHAEQTAQRFLEDLAFTDLGGELSDDSRLVEWRLHQNADVPVAGWLNEFDHTPLWRKPLVALRAIFPSPTALRAIDPFIGAGSWEVCRGWWRRLKRGIRTLPKARRNLNDSRAEVQ